MTKCNRWVWTDDDNIMLVEFVLKSIKKYKKPDFGRIIIQLNANSLKRRTKAACYKQWVRINSGELKLPRNHNTGLIVEPVVIKMDLEHRNAFNQALGAIIDAGAATKRRKNNFGHIKLGYKLFEIYFDKDYDKLTKRSSRDNLPKLDHLRYDSILSELGYTIDNLWLGLHAAAVYSHIVKVDPGLLRITDNKTPISWSILGLIGRRVKNYNNWERIIKAVKSQKLGYTKVRNTLYQYTDTLCDESGNIVPIVKYHDILNPKSNGQQVFVRPLYFNSLKNPIEAKHCQGITDISQLDKTPKIEAKTLGATPDVEKIDKSKLRDLAVFQTPVKRDIPIHLKITEKENDKFLNAINQAGCSKEEFANRVIRKFLSEI